MSNDFTVGLSVYKQPVEWIIKAISSVVDQSYINWKLRIRLDGENALAQEDYIYLQSKLDKYKKYDIELIKGIANLGTFASYKSIFDDCSTEYLIQLDADDYLDPLMLECTQQALVGKPESPFAYTLCKSINDNGEFLFYDKRALTPWRKNQDILQFISFHGRAIRTKIYQKVGGYSSSFQFSGDYDLCLKLAEYGDPIFVAKPLYFYRVYSNSASQKNRQITHHEAVEASRQAMSRRGLSKNWDYVHHPIREIVSLHNKFDHPILVAGMHRSGTSLLSMLLNELDLDFGNELLAEDDDNPTGYFEHLEIVRCHEAWFGCYFKDLGECLGYPVNSFCGISANQRVPSTGLQEWRQDARQYVAHRLQLLNTSNLSKRWGWKDPRTTLLLSFWQSILSKIRVLGAYRAPWDVSDSLVHVQHFELFRSHEYLLLEAWSAYNQALLDFYDGFPECIVLLNGEEIKNNADRIVEILEQRWDLCFLDDSVDNFKAKIIDNRLIHAAPKRTILFSLYKLIYPKILDQFMRLDSISDVPSRYEPIFLDHISECSCVAGNCVLYCLIPIKSPSHLLLQTIASTYDNAPEDLRIENVLVSVGEAEGESIKIIDALKKFGLTVINIPSSHSFGSAILQAIELLDIDSSKDSYFAALHEGIRLDSDFFKDGLIPLKNENYSIIIGESAFLKHSEKLEQGIDKVRLEDEMSLTCPCFNLSGIRSWFSRDFNTVRSSNYDDIYSINSNQIKFIPAVTYHIIPFSIENYFTCSAS